MICAINSDWHTGLRLTTMPFQKNAEFAENFNRRKPYTDNWMAFGVDIPGGHISLRMWGSRNRIGAEFYIDDNMALFYSLREKREEIESALGFKMEWQELSNKKASRIRVTQNANVSNRDEWESQFEWFSRMALKIKSVLTKYR